MFAINPLASSKSLRNIQGPNNVNATTVATSFGINVKDMSWTWVTTCNTLTIRPTTNVEIRMGAQIITAPQSNCAINCNATSELM